MSDIQSEALAVLADVWGLSPNVRLGQLMAHLGLMGEAAYLGSINASTTSCASDSSCTKY